MIAQLYPTEAYTSKERDVDFCLASMRTSITSKFGNLPTESSQRATRQSKLWTCSVGNKTHQSANLKKEKVDLSMFLV
jgi:hypothetical protein